MAPSVLSHPPVSCQLKAFASICVVMLLGFSRQREAFMKIALRSLWKGVFEMRVSCKPNMIMVLAFVCLGLLSGCLGHRDWRYPPSATGTYLSEQATAPLPLKAVVLPLEDLRGDGMKEEYWKAAIPLVPYGDTRYEKPEIAENPEKVDVVRFDPPNDFSKAITAEIDHAGLFSSVIFAPDGNQQDADVAIRGRLRSTNWNRRLYTYLLGPVGTIFWFVGAPMSHTTTGLQMDLQLIPVADPGKVLWSMSMEFEGKRLDGPYYGLEAAVESYPKAIQEALKPAIADLVNLANQDPQRLIPR